MTKTAFLSEIKTHMPAARYVMVGNAGEQQSPDKRSAAEAGWEFVLEKDFKEGL